MIVNKYNNGGGSGSGSTDLTNYWNSAVTQEHIESAASITYASAASYADMAVSGKADAKIVVDFDKTSQAERASLYADLKALYDGGSGATINKDYDFFKTVGTKQGLKIDYYTFSGNTLVFGKVVSPDNTSDQVVYGQVVVIDSAGNVDVVTNTVGGVDLSGYWTSAQTQSAITSAYTVLDTHITDVEHVTASAYTELHDGLMEVSAATSGKADAASVTANNQQKLPTWNSQGIITGTIGSLIYNQRQYMNGSYHTFLTYGNEPPEFYAPTAAGSAGQILTPSGNTPVWITPATINGSAITAGGNIEIEAGGITSADVKTQIEAYNYMDSTDAQVIATALVDLDDRVAIISAATPTVDLSGYYTSAQTDNAIASALTSYTPTSGFATINGSAITAGGNLVVQGGGDMSGYWTSAQTVSAITSVSGNLQSQIDTMDEVVGDAINDLNARVLHTVKSSDDSIINIVKIEQSDYDTLVSQSATTPTTLYVVVPDAQ